ncbi:MAG TPA: DUF481 domain-containing protein [Lentimicrobium sp.]|jgi:hypothetical protein|nr:DUF481 domain-containing protein [Lentimicrobium sp.]
MSEKPGVRGIRAFHYYLMMKKFLKYISAFIFFTGILFITFTVSAQVLNIERERIKTDTTGWSGSANISLNLFSNTKRFTEIGIDVHAQYKTSRSLYLALSDYEVIRSESSDFSNKGMQHLRYNYKITDIWILEAFGQAQFNKVLNLNFRGLAGAGLRVKMIGEDKLRLYGGMAYMYEYEEPLESPIEHNHRLSNYLSVSSKPVKHFNVVNTIYFQPRIDFFADYRVSNNLDLIFKISSRLSYALALEFVMDNRPLPDMPREVYSLKNKLILDFGK